MPISRRRTRIATLCGLVLAASAPLQLVGNDWADLRVPPDRMLGSLSCASSSCHGSNQPRTGQASSNGQEYLHWLGGTATSLDGRPHYDPRARVSKHDGDPHALAGRRLLEPRFQEVLRRASHLPGGEIDAAVSARCYSCHDPLSLASERSREPLGRGIGCESCHGGARDWVATHYQRGISRSRLTELGMIDTKDVLTRARVCAACHVGSAENDVNHDLLAAGHPPLRFEMASYQALIERKHWNDGPRRLAEPDYEVQLWAAGRIASADAALALLESRAKRAVATDETRIGTDQKEVVWPEFAEYNCFACHQSLRPATVGGARVALPWQSWNVTMAPLDAPAEEALGQLRTAIGRSLVTNPGEIAELAAEARSILRDAGNSMSAKEVLVRLADEETPLSWELACHRLAAIVALEHGSANEEVRRRAKLIGEALRFSRPEFEWPAVLGNPGSGSAPQSLSLQEIGEELNALRQLFAMEGQGP